MIKSGLACIVLSILAVLTGRCKNKYFSFVFPIVALCVAGICQSSSNAASQFKPDTLELYDSICFNAHVDEDQGITRIQQVKEDLNLLVDQWMCIGDCKCPKSAEAVWQSYD